MKSRGSDIRLPNDYWYLWHMLDSNTLNGFKGTVNRWLLLWVTFILFYFISVIFNLNFLYIFLFIIWGSEVTVKVACTDPNVYWYLWDMLNYNTLNVFKGTVNRSLLLWVI